MGTSRRMQIRRPVGTQVVLRAVRCHAEGERTSDPSCDARSSRASLSLSLSVSLSLSLSLSLSRRHLSLSLTRAEG